MKIVELVRLEESEQGTLGVLKIDKELYCLTLEPPDRLNQRSRSSIPAQQYVCRRVNSPKYGNTFTVLDVPWRDHVLFHAGNIAAHTQGCILLGESQGKLRGSRAVLNSGKTFQRFMEIMEGENEFHLTIATHY